MRRMRSRLVALSLLVATGVVAGYVILGREPADASGPPKIQMPDFASADVLPVARVVDGDTIAVAGQAGEIKVRLIGVDTPETVHPSKPVQEYGKEASRFTTNLLKGEKVYLLYEGEKPATDKYGRTLAYVYRYPDGLFVNAEIIRQGYGHAYTRFPFKYLEEFRGLEKFAREAGKGLWEAGPAAAPPDPTHAEPVVPKAEEPPRPPAVQGVTVYVTRTGKKYHREGCRYLRSSKIPMKLEEAKQRYEPCSVCGPPR